jgi:hypothetical protein
MDACKSLPQTIANNWNAMTYYELVEKIGIKVNMSIIWTVEEWSMLSDYHRELLMAIASKVQTDRKFERLVKVGTYSQQILIDNCDLMLLIAIQPFKFRKLMKESDNWNSMASDRFTKFPFINPLQQDTKEFYPKFELPDCCLSLPIEFKFRPNKILTEIFEDHLTRGRAELASIKFQRAWCRLNNQDSFSDIDAYAFRALYSPYLSLFPLMIKVTDPDNEDSFYTGPFRILEYMMDHFYEPKTIHQIERAFHMVEDETNMSERTIYRHMKVLESKNIIKQNSPTYSLSPYYQNYFENYKKNWS